MFQRNEILKILVLLSLIITAGRVNSQPHWGVRNIKVNQHTVLMNKMSPTYQNWALQWNLIEPAQGMYNFAIIDEIMVFINDTLSPAIPCFTINPADSWANPGTLSSAQGPPNDLDFTSPLTTMPDSGYSKSLYRFVAETVNYIDSLYSGPIYMRYVVEPAKNWVTNDSSDIDKYIRCLRTFYKACHDIADTSDMQMNVSHGGFHSIFASHKWWYSIGNNAPLKRDSIADLFNSYADRYVPGYYSSWSIIENEVVDNTQETDWIYALTDNTDWVDFHDIHTHYKPWFIESEIEALNAAIVDKGHTPKPYLAMEAAMFILSGAALPFEEVFHANDMARKWIIAASQDVKAICTPIIGAPSNMFYGFKLNNANKYKALNAYYYLREILPNMLNNMTDLSTPDIYHFRWEDENIEIVWKKALLDLDTSTVDFNLMGYSIDSLTNVLRDTVSVPSNYLYDLGQELLILHGMYTGIDDYSIDNQQFFYPNPTYGKVYLTNVSESMQLKLFNSLGQIVKLKRNNHELDLSSEPPGLYLLKIMDKETIVTNKLIKN